MQFSARQRLRKSEEFQAFQRNGHKINCNYFLFIAIKRSKDSLPICNRIGIIASRKVGNAVIRNGAKRIFREIFRANQHLLPQYTDILVIARRGYAKQSFDELKNRFLKACKSL